MYYSVFHISSVYHTKRCEALRKAENRGSIVYKYEKRDGAVNDGLFRECSRCIKEDADAVKYRRRKAIRDRGMIKFIAARPDPKGKLRITEKDSVWVSAYEMKWLSSINSACHSIHGPVCAAQARYFDKSGALATAGIPTGLRKKNLVLSLPMGKANKRRSGASSCVMISDKGSKVLSLWEEMKASGSPEPGLLVVD